MLSSFGKKKSTPKEMYCIKRTKAGKRVVKVVTVTRRGREVKIYASSRRAVASSVHCWTRKSQAQAELKRMKAGKTSSFGSKKTASKVFPYGYTACISTDSDEYGQKKYRVYKYYPVSHDYMKYRIVLSKDKYSEEKKFFLLEEAHKGFNVKVTGTAAERRVSDIQAKEKAKELAKKYELLSYVPGGANLVPCDWKSASTLAESPGAPPAVRKAAKNPFQESLTHSTRAAGLQGMTFPPNSQLEEVSARNTGPAFDGRFSPVVNTNRLSNQMMEAAHGGDFVFHGPRLKDTTASNRPILRNPISGSQRMRFGRFNYGFSRYF